MSFTPSQVWKCRRCGATNAASKGKCVDCGLGYVSPDRPIHILNAPITMRPHKSKKCKRSDGYDSQLEADWAVVLAQRHGNAWRHHGVILRLPVKDENGKLRFDNYTPDFVSWDTASDVEPGWQITVWECKGNHRFRRAGVERFKRFAEQTPWARFVLVERENGQWKETVI